MTEDDRRVLREHMENPPKTLAPETLALLASPEVEAEMAGMAEMMRLHREGLIETRPLSEFRAKLRAKMQP